MVAMRSFYKSEARTEYYLMIYKILLAFAVLTCAGCVNQQPWLNYKISKEPDFRCKTGHEAGYDYYVWNCLNNEKVVIYQWTTAFYNLPSKMEKARCSELTKFEQSIADKSCANNAYGSESKK